MFDHTLSSPCKYDKDCNRKLCSFQHKTITAINNEEPKEFHNKTENYLKEAFEKLEEEEKDESTMILCDNYCKASYGYHLCRDDFDNLVGCDLLNITNEYDSDEDYKATEYFPCEQCNNKFDEYDKLKKHFDKSHKIKQFMECRINQCEYEAKSVDMLMMHIGVNHNELVKQRLE